MAFYLSKLLFNASLILNIFDLFWISPEIFLNIFDNLILNLLDLAFGVEVEELEVVTFLEFRNRFISPFDQMLYS